MPSLFKPIFVGLCLVFALTLIAIPRVARADQITFDVAGTFYQEGTPSINGTYSATFTVDTTTGLVTSASVTDPNGTLSGPSSGPFYSGGVLLQTQLEETM